MEDQSPRRRGTQFNRLPRRQRILDRLREGFAYDEVAGEEKLTERRIRQIVAEYLNEREALRA